MTFQRFYRYDFASTQIFVDLMPEYFGVAVSGHVLSYTPKSVVQLLNEIKKPFFVDPMTFVFSRKVENISRNGKIRRSYLKLIDDLGPPFSECVAGKSLSPTRFKQSNGQLNEGLIRETCDRVLHFELTKCKVSTSFPKYAQLLKKGALPQSVSPHFLVPPYFYSENRGSDWYQISLHFAKAAKDTGLGPIFPVICMFRGILWDDPQINGIVQDYQGFDGYIIWINDLDERAISADELKGLKSLVSKLAAYGQPVYSLYGGYLCDLLRRFGLSGYSSGICYGEDRSVDAVGGGAGNRYYVPIAHLKISEDLANAFLAQSANNSGYMCSCPTCSKIRSLIPGSSNVREYVGRYFTLMDFLDFRRHFVEVKFIEGNALDSMTNQEIIQAMDNDAKALLSIDTFPRHPVELKPYHLWTWRTMFLKDPGL